MRLDIEQFEDGLTKVNLFGRMDIAGVEEIIMRLTATTAVERRRVILDVSGVDFLASMGVRAILQNARALRLRGGSMVVMGANELVAEVLDSTGAIHVVPVVPDIDAARAALAAP